MFLDLMLVLGFYVLATVQGGLETKKKKKQKKIYKWILTCFQSLRVTTGRKKEITMMLEAYKGVSGVFRRAKRKH